MRMLNTVTALAALAALACAPAALAGNHVSQTLNPPPPSYYTCKAVGHFTFCDGMPPLESWGPIDTADEGTPMACGSGAGAFHIFDRGADQVSAHRVYDGGGNLIRRVLRDDYRFGEFSNPLTGTAVRYDQHDIRIGVLAVPGDLGSATETTIWNIHVRAPKGGAPLLVNAGVTVAAPDGTITFRAGRLDFFDLFLDGDTSVLDPLCAALST